MTSNQLLTAGAIGFAAFAVIYLQRQAGAPAPAAVSPQPAQRQRDAGLSMFLGNWTAQEQLGKLSGSGVMSYGPDFSDTINKWRLTP